jgi:uncharacterized damage-inducible protein DinB
MEETAVTQRFGTWFRHERYANDKMLAMLESVPEDKRSDPSFARALTLAAHLAACRENWLNSILESGKQWVDWFPSDVSLNSLRPRYASMESKWTAYFEALTNEELARYFVFEDGGSRWRLGVETQVYQLFGHAAYHRGQVAILVDQLGGEVIDTDYVDWAFPQDPNCGEVD